MDKEDLQYVEKGLLKTENNELSIREALKKLNEGRTTDYNGFTIYQDEEGDDYYTRLLNPEDDESYLIIRADINDVKEVIDIYNEKGFAAAYDRYNKFPEDTDTYTPQLTTDPFAAGQWYESLDKNI